MSRGSINLRLVAKGYGELRLHYKYALLLIVGGFTFDILGSNRSFCHNQHSAVSVQLSDSLHHMASPTAVSLNLSVFSSNLSIFTLNLSNYRSNPWIFDSNLTVFNSNLPIFSSNLATFNSNLSVGAPQT